MLHSINMMRTLSCLLIAVFHVTEYANAHSTGLYLTFKLASPGFHLFLLISGVILILTSKPGDAPHRFFLKRAVRIIPVYWLALTATLAMALISPWLFYEIDLSASSVISSYLFLPHFDRGDDIQPILYVGWTLNYIMLFYLLFAVSRYAPGRFQIQITIGLLVAVLIGARFLPVEAYRQFYSDPILLEFAMGCVLGLILKRAGVASWAARTPMWPFALIGIAGLAAATLLDYDGYLEVLTFAPAGAFLVFACAAQDLYREPLKLGLLNEGGKISYGIYLIHPLILPVLATLIFGALGHGWLSICLLTASLLGMTVILAWCSLQYFELPVNRWLRERLGLGASRPKAGRAYAATSSARLSINAPGRGRQ